MAKNGSTRGKGAKDGQTARAASSGASTGGNGAGAGKGDGSPALDGGGAAAKKATAKKSAGAGGATAKKSTAKKSTAKKSGGAGSGAAAGSGGLRGELRDFARSRPGGWGHDDWQRLLGDLRGRGHDVSDERAVGMQLERERLAHQLEGVDGLGRKADALVDRFETVYSLRQASVDDVAGVKGMNRQLAERVKERFS